MYSFEANNFNAAYNFIAIYVDDILMLAGYLSDLYDNVKASWPEQHVRVFLIFASNLVP